MIKGIILLIVSLGILSTPCTAQTIVIDGKLDDWGITDSELDSGLNSDDINSWIPDKCPNADWIVENDLAGDWGSDPVVTWNESSGKWDFRFKGVHQMSTESGYTSSTGSPYVYDKNSNSVPKPSGGERYDIEALYFDDDSRYIYFALVLTSEVAVGDLAINGAYGNYGVVLNDTVLVLGNVYRDCGWIHSYWAKKSPTEEMNTCIDPENPGSLVGKADVAINDNIGIFDNGYDNKIIELRIDKTDIGYPKNGSTSNFGYAFSCGNDFIEREVTYNYDTIPEFSTIAIPLAIIIGLFYFRIRR